MDLKKTYDAIVVGTGAAGGFAAKDRLGKKSGASTYLATYARIIVREWAGPPLTGPEGAGFWRTASKAAIQIHKSSKHSTSAAVNGMTSNLAVERRAAEFQWCVKQLEKTVPFESGRR